MTVNLGTYPKLIRTPWETTEGRTHMVGWTHEADARDPTKWERSDMAWATTTAKQMRPVQWSVPVAVAVTARPRTGEPQPVHLLINHRK